MASRGIMFAPSKEKYFEEKMRLTRREILEQLERLGVRGISSLKRACREFEAHWNKMLLGIE
ncbi:MAG TPA: hypothetical protein PLA83_13030 [Deltaproteobacteria bacterium]|jgi:hypothetical protein|nr:hypothetical protein [Deltaproteobacteria bacterium]HQI00430.1 hypothetical protein [Deltaproteobacteria bacterium]HQJ09409.1 hypothetical protein [Deltaproteobacteria bacterium]